MQLSKHFKLEEFTKSQIAARKRIKNQPSSGDILLFPSNFMFPHEVKEITKGIRYSFVSWAF
jgi:predicted 2-oxoglutarate/Fe(II)-dependent dioxygenase YbiX